MIIGLMIVAIWLVGILTGMTVQGILHDLEQRDN